MDQGVSVLRELLKKYLKDILPIDRGDNLPTPEELEKEVRRYE